MGSVYGDLRLLQLTMDQLRATPWLEIPADNRRLVEGASHPERVATLSGVRWDRHAQNVAGSAIAARVVAEFPLLTRFESSRFGEFVFQELPAAARTRLGIDTLQVRLDRCVQSPFGVELAEVTIPGHMAPDRPQDQEATVVTAEEGVIGLSYGGQQYTYTRMGLERTDEPAQ